MWFVLPRLAAIGSSTKSQLFGNTDLREYAAYAAHPLLGQRLLEISTTILLLKDKRLEDVFTTPI